MAISLKSVNVINLFAEDFIGTKSFYQEVFGLPLIFEDEDSALFQFENVMVMVRDVSAASEFIPSAAVGSPEGGPRFVLAVFVDDVDAACTELAHSGDAAQRAGRPAVGDAYRQLLRPRRSCLGDRSGPGPEVVEGGLLVARGRFCDSDVSTELPPDARVPDGRFTAIRTRW